MTCPQSRSTAQRIFEKQTSSLLQSLKELNFSHSLRRGELFNVRVFHVFWGLLLFSPRKKKKRKKKEISELISHKIENSGNNF